ncbi:MAG: hypothetical protein ACTSU5_16905 [Promethearchaeota archaeon]
MPKKDQRIQQEREKLELRKNVKKAIQLLCEKQVSKTVILSSYKINAVLKTNFGVNARVDKVGRVLSRVAKANKLKRLTTNIPKFVLKKDELDELVIPGLPDVEKVKKNA